MNTGKLQATLLVIIGRNEVVAKVMFLLVSVILLTPQEDGYCCGRYASYWNAFLFLLWTKETKLTSNRKSLMRNKIDLLV